MKKATLLIQSIAFFAIFMFTMPAKMQAQTAVPPAAGDGTETNPYEIATIKNLFWLSQNNAEWNKHYIQTANIDASVSETWDNGAGFTPIGNENIKFTGTYYGLSHTIDNLYINRPNKNSVGLFGFVDQATAIINNLGVTNADVNGEKYVGTLAGRLRGGKVIECYSTGSVNAHLRIVGGLIGHIYQGTVKMSFSKANVSSDGDYLGGLVGYTNEGNIHNCYSHSTVSGTSYIGGLIGKAVSTTIRFSYSKGQINHQGGYGGLVGVQTLSSADGCFWDIETSGLNTSALGIGKTSDEMKSFSTFENAGWDITSDIYTNSSFKWGINQEINDGYPCFVYEVNEPQPSFVLENPEIKMIQSYSATYSDYILLTSNAVINNHGVCWSESRNPTIENNHTSNGSVTENEAFETVISNLNGNTKYYVRHYVIVNDNVFYGQELNFTTLPETEAPDGYGTEENPYQIANMKNLYWLSQNSAEWDKHYIQTADIDASETESWHGDNGFEPIGTEDAEFTGSYNGQFHSIDQIYINRPNTNNIGLFGFVAQETAIITKLGVTNANITGKSCVGGIIGKLSEGSLHRCHTTGTVITGNSEAGGLLGHNYEGYVKECFSFTDVSSSTFAGGLIGKNTKGTINDCYSRGSVSSDWMCGGLIGSMTRGILRNCYSTGLVNSPDLSYLGGLVGNEYEAVVENSFWDIQTSGTEQSPAGTGLSTSEMKTSRVFTNAGWDFIDETNNGIELLWSIRAGENDLYPFLTWEKEEYYYTLPIINNNKISNIEEESAIFSANIAALGYVDISNHGVCWNKNGYPTISDAHTSQGPVTDTGQFTSNISGLKGDILYYARPFVIVDNNVKYGETTEFRTPPGVETPEGQGTESDPYKIISLENLHWLSINYSEWDKHYIQTATIDASTTRYWNNGKGFSPIGNPRIPFTGTYNGMGHTINGLYIDRPESRYIGLFGFLSRKITLIKQLGVKEASIAGGNHTGVLAGYNNGATLKNTFTSGRILSKSSAIGGFVGTNYGYINNCYADVDVSGRAQTGGFIGKNYLANVHYCYSTGNVRGDEETGGFIGKNNEGSIYRCFYDRRASGQPTSDGGVGLDLLTLNVNKILIRAGWDYIKETGNGTNDYWMPNEKKPMYFPLLEWQGIGNSPGGLEYRKSSMANAGNEIQMVEVTAYPNPFSDYLNIKSSNKIKAIRILDMNGSVKLNTTRKSNINTSNLQSGIYILLIEDEEGKIYQEKIIRR
jgi:hypothetical protein